MRVAIFDDVLHARGEDFHVPGLEVELRGHADDASNICVAGGTPEVIFMDYAMGPGHKDGAAAIRALRADGFKGKIVAMSSDPNANAAMIQAGADEALPRKAMLGAYLVALAKSSR